MLGTLRAILIFPALLYAPGYLAGHAANLFGFRQRPFAEQSLWSIALSFSLAPIAAHLTGRLAGLSTICWLFGLLALGAALLLVVTRPAWPARDRRITILLAAGLTFATLYLLTDLQIGHRLYFSVVMADQSYRISFTDAVARTGIPPANPLYFAGQAAPMRYFYFWYVLCAAVMKLGHVTARQAFTASTVWAGFGLLATVQLFTTHFFQWSPKRRWIALGLLAVNGADLIPAVGQALLQPTLNGNTEWWSVDPIFAWPDSLLWVPHHVASVLCCLTGFLLLWPQPNTGRHRRWPIVFAASAFASAFGLSSYVAFGFALMLAAWLLRLWLVPHADRFAITRQCVLTLALALALVAPFLLEVLSHAPAPPGTSAPSPFSISVRRLIDSGLLTDAPLFASWHHTHPVLLDQSLRLLLLLPGLAMELGLYGAVLVLLLLFGRRRGPSAAPHGPHATAIFFTVGGLILTLFVSSSVITNNDFGYRAVMLPQFFLLLLTAELLGAWRFAPETTHVPLNPSRRRLLGSLLILGILGTAWWALLLRGWLPFEAAHPATGFAHSPEDSFQIREAFQRLDQIAPANAVVAFRPIDPTPDRQGAVMVPNEYYQRMLVMNAGRQLLNAEGKCATHFGGDPAPCPEIQRSTAQLYALPAPSAVAAQQYCQRLGVQYLVLSSWDPGWTSLAGWPASLPVAVAEPRFRIYACA